MTTQNQNECRCKKTSCGCAGVATTACSCGEKCGCKSACRCGAGCNCKSVK